MALVSACKIQQEPEGAPQGSASATISIDTPPAPPPKINLAPAGRGEVLAAVAAAADAAASGRSLPRGTLQLANRTFELHLPFGCAGSAVGAWGQVRVDPASGVRRVTVSPQRWDRATPIAALAQGQTFDSIEGFWLDRPWTTAETCPDPLPAPQATAPADGAGDKSPPAPPPLVASPQSVAIAQFFAPEASRTSQRKDRPYTYTGKLRPDDPGADSPMRLRLTGRITTFADGQPVRCVVTDPVQRPLCVVAVEFTGVAFEVGTSGRILAEWNY